MSGIGFQENSVSETGQKWSPFPHLCPPGEQGSRSERSHQTPQRGLPANENGSSSMFKRIFQGVFGLTLSIPISLTALFISVAVGATNARARFNP
jgi:hypothetical protein